MSSGTVIRYGWLDEPKRKKRKKPKWGPPDASSLFYTMPKCIPHGLTTEQTESLLIRFRIEEITRKINLNELDIDYNDRSPSPEPIYDTHGKRVNTREQRAKDKLNTEWQRMIEMAMAMNPQFKPPADYNPATTKKQRKIYVPTERFPEYNFIGLILGPRGATQKEMEKETGAKILIRGKGSVKDGKTARKDGGKTKTLDDEPLHVLVIADTEEQIEQASARIASLLVPVEEGKNEHKRQQLRMLALMNGTLRDRENFTLGERTWEPANVKCSICGEVSHPTSDCPFKGKDQNALPAEKIQKIESEYDKFLADIGGFGSNPAADPYDELMKSIKEGEPGSQAPAPWEQQQSAPWLAQPQQPAAPWQQQSYQAYPGYQADRKSVV